MKKHLYKIVVLLLLAINIKFIYNDIVQKQHLNELYRRFFDRGMLNSVVTPATHLSNNIVVKSSLRSKQKYKLFVVLTDIYCRSCIQHEIVNLNGLYKKYPQFIEVKYISSKNTNLEQLGANFPYNKVNENYKFTEEQTDLTPPFVAVLDSLNRINFVYRTEFNNYKKSDLFFERMAYLFSNIKL